MDRISISEFKAVCLRLLARVQSSGRPITITKKGEPLVVIYPAASQSTRVPFGASVGTGTILGDVVEPLDPKQWALDNEE